MLRQVADSLNGQTTNPMTPSVGAFDSVGAGKAYIEDRLLSERISLSELEHICDDCGHTFIPSAVRVRFKSELDKLSCPHCGSDKVHPE
jgi:Zn finger protein HypA/HybF involved in hydrogenase expression